jgi:hypothetical protein
MTFYRCYPLDRDRKISGPPVIVSATSDEDALSKADVLPHQDTTFEVWEGNTVIGTVVAGHADGNRACA